MPRIAKPHPFHLHEVRKQLRTHLSENEINPTEFAKSVGITQSTIQRFLSGRTKNVTPLIRKALFYAGIDEKKCIITSTAHIQSHPKILDALERVWDGSEEAAETLANVIVAVGGVLANKSPSQRSLLKDEI